MFLPNLSNTKHPSECPCIYCLVLLYHQQQPPIFSGHVTVTHVSTCLWSVCGSLCFRRRPLPLRAPLQISLLYLLDFAQEISRAAFCTLPETLCWLYSVCFIVIFIITVEAACKPCYVFSTLIITVKLLNL